MLYLALGNTGTDVVVVATRPVGVVFEDEFSRRQMASLFNRSMAVNDHE
jgi:hypothetical protein